MRRPPVEKPSTHADRLERIERQLAVDPENAHLHAQAAFCLSHLGNNKRMLAEAKKAAELDAQAAWNHHLISVALRRLGRPRLAKQAIDAAISLDPENPLWHLSLAEFHGERKRWRQALAEADVALRLDPESQEALRFRAHALSILGRRDQAVAVARDALREDPDSPGGHTQLGWVHLYAGRQAEAQQAFREALRIDPDFEDAHEGLLRSLRSIFPPYRWLIMVTAWLERQPPAVQMMTGVAAYPIARVCGYVLSQNPKLWPILVPVIAFYASLVLLRLFGHPLANIVLLFHPLGSLALGRRRRNESAAMGTTLALGLIGLLLSLISPIKCWMTAGFSGLLFVLLAMLARENERVGRKKHPWAVGYWLSAGSVAAVLVLDVVTRWESVSHAVAP